MLLFIPLLSPAPCTGGQDNFVVGVKDTGQVVFPATFDYMSERPKPKLTLDEQIAADILWEATTELKGWKKTLGFLERVMGDEEWNKIDARISRGLSEQIDDPDLKQWFTDRAERLEDGD